MVPVRQQVAVANDNEDAIAAAAAAEQTIVRRSASYTGHTGIKKNRPCFFSTDEIKEIKTVKKQQEPVDCSLW